MAWRAGTCTIDTWPDSDRARLIRELRTRSTHDAARTFGVSQALVYGWAKRNGISLARTGGAKLAARKGRAA